MADASGTTRFRFWLWLIGAIGVMVPRRLRADSLTRAVSNGSPGENNSSRRMT